jgi:hypothetical protein
MRSCRYGSRYIDTATHYSIYSPTQLEEGKDRVDVAATIWIRVQNFLGSNPCWDTGNPEVYVSHSRKILEHYVDYATVGCFQILFNHLAVHEGVSFVRS